MDPINDSSEYTEIILFPAQALWAPILSIAATLAVIILCILQRSYNDFLGTMIMLLNFSDLIFCTAKVLGSIFIPTTDLGCKLFQMVSSAGLVSSVIITALFGHTLWVVSCSGDAELAKRNLKKYIYVGIVFPSVLAVAAVFTNFIQSEIKDGSNICVHRVHKGDLDFTHLLFTTIPIISSLILSLIWYLLAALKLKNLLVEGKIQNLIVLIIYPAILWVCWAPYIIMSFFVMFGQSISLGVMTVCRALDQLQGFFDAIVFWPGTRKIVRELYKRACICNKQKRRASSAAIEEATDDDLEFETESLKNSLITKQRLRTLAGESPNLGSTRLTKSPSIHFKAQMLSPHSIN